MMYSIPESAYGQDRIWAQIWMVDKSLFITFLLHSSFISFNSYLLNIYYSFMLCIWAKRVKNSTVIVFKQLKNKLENISLGIGKYNSECRVRNRKDLIMGQQRVWIEEEIRNASGKVTRRLRVILMKQKLQKQRKWCI